MGKDQWRIPSKEELAQMAAVDVRNVDSSTLAVLEDVKIDTSLPKEERIAEYLRQIKNPYCYVSNGVTVKISFAGKRSLEECISKCISME